MATSAVPIPIESRRPTGSMSELGTPAPGSRGAAPRAAPSSAAILGSPSPVRAARRLGPSDDRPWTPGLRQDGPGRLVAGASAQPAGHPGVAVGRRQPGEPEQFWARLAGRLFRAGLLRSRPWPPTKPSPNSPTSCWTCLPTAGSSSSWTTSTACWIPHLCTTCWGWSNATASFISASVTGAGSRANRSRRGQPRFGRSAQAISCSMSLRSRSWGGSWIDRSRPRMPPHSGRRWGDGWHPPG